MKQQQTPIRFEKGFLTIIYWGPGARRVYVGISKTELLVEGEFYTLYQKACIGSPSWNWKKVQDFVEENGHEFSGIYIPMYCEFAYDKEPPERFKILDKGRNYVVLEVVGAKQ